MNFVSVEFAGFLAVVYMLHWSCRSAGARKWLLTIASYVFYAVWNWRFCFLMLFVTVNAFAAGQILARATGRRRTAVLAGSIGVDLAVLGFFKYFDFFLSNAAAALADLGVSVSLPVMRIILPVGISFYTFHAIIYVVDVYRGKIGPERSFINIALYISFFPQLIAGPIVRASFPHLPFARRWWPLARTLSGEAPSRARMQWKRRRRGYSLRRLSLFHGARVHAFRVPTFNQVASHIGASGP